jgi:hypothetical protein
MSAGELAIDANQACANLGLAKEKENHLNCSRKVTKKNWNYSFSR